VQKITASHKSQCVAVVDVNKTLFSSGLKVDGSLSGSVWNSLPRLLCDTSHNTTRFGHSLKTFLLSDY